jgi:nucleoside-diphosphate-sugar epimerase
LRERNFDVAIFHRGTHEADDEPVLGEVEHVHGDPHFADAIADALGEREFDVVVAAYGRTRLIAEQVAGRCGQFVGVGGSAVYPGWGEPDKNRPYGMRVLARESDELVEVVTAPSKSEQFTNAMIRTERTVFELHDRGAFVATWLRYPRIYGPRNLMPYEWSVLRRVRDGRGFLALHEDGLQIRTRCSAWNAAHSVLLAVDRSVDAAGEIFNVGDDYQASERQWARLITDVLGAQLEIVTVPAEFSPSRFLTPFAGTASPHCIMDTAKIRALLGYRDVTSAGDALRTTLAWLDGHPVTAEAYPAFQDRFDYEHEDRVVAAYRDALDRMRELARPPATERPTHAYAHPTNPGAVADVQGR